MSEVIRDKLTAGERNMLHEILYSSQSLKLKLEHILRILKDLEEHSCILQHELFSPYQKNIENLLAKSEAVISDIVSTLVNDKLRLQLVNCMDKYLRELDAMKQ